MSHFLKYTPGHFSLVIDRDDWQLGVVGRHQLFPVFYKEGERLAFATAATRLGEVNLDSPQAQVFSYAAFCPGETTSVNGVKQLAAGSYIWQNKGAADNKVRGFYFDHWHTYPPTAPQSPRPEALRQICYDIIDYTIAQANGGPIALSLSGGYDSRLLAILLKDRGYDNVHCLTYGNPDSFETKRARQTAEALGYPWVFVAYTDDNAALFFDDEAERYRRYAARGSMLPYEQDYIAIREIKRRRLVPEDSLMLIGHFADLTAGKSLPDPLVVKRLMNQDRRPDMQLAHDHLFPDLEWDSDGLDCIDNTFGYYFGEGSPTTVEEVTARFENWKTLNFTVKHPNQSIRVQEFYGYRWCMPFMHPDWLKFWYTAPFEARYKRRLFRATVERYFFQPYGIDTSAPDIDHLLDRSTSLARMRAMTPKPLRKLLKRLLKPAPDNQSGMDALRQRMYEDLGKPEGYQELESNAQYAHWLCNRYRNGLR